MSFPIEDKLVFAISSSALFYLSESVSKARQSARRFRKNI